MRLLPLLAAATLAAAALPATASAEGWFGPQPVAPSDAHTADLAVDHQGGAVLVYARSGANVEASFRPPGGTFGPAQVLTTSGINPDVAMAADGTAVVTWASSAPTIDATVQAAVRAPGQGFGPAQTVATAATAEPQVVMNRRGDAAVLFSSSTGIAAVRRAPGGSFEAPVALGAGSFVHSASGLDGDGDLTTVWERFAVVGGGSSGAGDFRIEAADLPRAASAWSAVDTLATGDAQLPRLSVGEDGTAVATVLGATPLRTITRPAGGAWGSMVPAIDGFGTLDVDDAGVAHLVWHDDAAGTVLRRTRLANGTAGPAQQLGTEMTGTFDGRAIGLPDGRELSVWQFTTNAFLGQPINAPRATMRAADGTLETTVLGMPGTNVSLHPEVARNGKAVVLGESVSGGSPVAWVRDDAWPAEPDRVVQPQTPQSKGGSPVQQRPVDRTPPALEPTAAKRLKLGATSVKLRLTCSEACLVQVTGDVDPKGKARKVKLKGRSVGVAAGTATTVKVALPKKVRSALRRAGGGVVRLRTVAVDAAGNRTSPTTVKVTVAR
ncbi:hypothetical protein [Conexibacter sp. SYSU D00693]|uniref:hypothetical protein n=1 Tax=Conexibacter sp. SYSU D00693 TaxID=2812560 RepID=UPI00196A3DB0|nr:hypothetical protein [Conexibacter sp. SYSU D00693]